VSSQYTRRVGAPASQNTVRPSVWASTLNRLDLSAAGFNNLGKPEARAGKSGAVEVSKDKHVILFFNIIYWVSLEDGENSSVAAVLDMQTRRG